MGLFSTKKNRDPKRVMLGHQMADPQVVSHCPFCGSGDVIARSDGNIGCNFCERQFIVREQPQFSALPGQPGPNGPADVNDPDLQVPVSDGVLAQAPAFVPPGAEKEDPAPPPVDKAPPEGTENPFAKKGFRTVTGATDWRTNTSFGESVATRQLESGMALEVRYRSHGEVTEYRWGVKNNLGSSFSRVSGSEPTLEDAKAAAEAAAEGMEPTPPVVIGGSFHTASGSVLDEDAYALHLALRHGDRKAILASRRGN